MVRYCSALGGAASQTFWIAWHEVLIEANRTSCSMRIGSFRSASANLSWV
ncbi:MAG: hypothetical protein ABIF19_04235 [Planctomycetota bacterium]